MSTQSIKKIASYLGTQNYNISYTDDQVIVSCGGREGRGLTGAVLVLVPSAHVHTAEEAAQLYQWLELASTHANTNNKTLLKELNKYLENCSYLVGYSKTLADVIIYHLVHQTIESLSHSEREAYLDLCRWFDHIQQDDDVRQDNSKINFSSTYLSSKLASGY